MIEIVDEDSRISEKIKNIKTGIRAVVNDGNVSITNSDTGEIISCDSTAKTIGDCVLYAHIKLIDDGSLYEDGMSNCDLSDKAKQKFELMMRKYLNDDKLIVLENLEILDGRKARLMKQLEEVERASREYRASVDILNRMLVEGRQ